LSHKPTLRATTRGASCKTESQDGVAFSFLVGFFDFLQHAGLSRRTPITRSGGVPSNRKNADLAPNANVALMPVETAEGQKAQNQVTFLENFFDESRLSFQISNKNQQFEVV